MRYTAVAFWSMSYSIFSRRCVTSFVLTFHKRFGNVKSIPQSCPTCHFAAFSSSNDYSSLSLNHTGMEEDWHVYAEMMQTVIQSDSVARAKQKVSNEEMHHVQRYLLQQKLLTDQLGTPPSCILSNVTNGNTTTSEIFRIALNQRANEFRKVQNFTQPAMDFCKRSITYLADLCAKRQLVTPCIIAWSKLRECGQIPRENTLSTFMYVLSLENEDQNKRQSKNNTDTNEALLEVAAYHDLLYQPNEKSITLRIKTLIRKGDTAAAYQCLSALPDKPSADHGNRTGSSLHLPDEENDQKLWKRLRTYTPLLHYFCQTGNCTSAVRLFRDMRTSKGVHMDGSTYALVLGTAMQLGWSISPGQEKDRDICLINEIMEGMAEDVLELDENYAENLLTVSAYVSPDNLGRATNDATVAICKTKRVSVNPKSAICPETGVRLRLFQLTPEQRQHVHNRLLQMAAVEHEEFLQKMKGPKRDIGGNVAIKELSKFSDWLRLRTGAPYTAFVDGPNVAYFGNGDMKWEQVRLVVDELERMGEIPLVIMPRKYVSESFTVSRGALRKLSEKEVNTMNSLVYNAERKVYVVPQDCFDDFYWMISSVVVQGKHHVDGASTLHVSIDDELRRFPGLRPLVVTNDQMRDHKLNLLEPRLFRRWSSSHMVKYAIRGKDGGNENVTFYPADFFSREIQSNPSSLFRNSTIWHIPVSEWPHQDRLCLMVTQNGS